MRVVFNIVLILCLIALNQSMQCPSLCSLLSDCSLSYCIFLAGQHDSIHLRRRRRWRRRPSAISPSPPHLVTVTFFTSNWDEQEKCEWQVNVTFFLCEILVDSTSWSTSSSLLILAIRAFLLFPFSFTSSSLPFHSRQGKTAPWGTIGHRTVRQFFLKDGEGYGLIMIRFPLTISEVFKSEISDPQKKYGFRVLEILLRILWWDTFLSADNLWYLLRDKIDTKTVWKYKKKTKTRWKKGRKATPLVDRIPLRSVKKWGETI